MIISLFSVFHLSAQDVGLTGEERGFILKQEYSFHLTAHSEGLGLGGRWGAQNTVYAQRFIDFDLLGMKHPKEIKRGGLYMYDDARKFVYGKQNSVFISRLGLGSVTTLNEKPYWGGIDVRRFYSFGLSVAMAKPVYLYILRQTTTAYYYDLVLERYNPAIHDLTNIYGRGPFLEGLGESKFYPGLYFKGGVSFEYGHEKSTVRYLEVGVAADAYLSKIPMMAYDKSRNYFITFYISGNFGRRYNP